MTETTTQTRSADPNLQIRYGLTWVEYDGSETTALPETFNLPHAIEQYRKMKTMPERAGRGVALSRRVYSRPVGGGCWECVENDFVDACGGKDW